ncbi:MAG TPA: HD-GYP domain-containing protein [Patescibacteria group bacterium]|nr:HD-GYP domain-containing protein [Patescibacteria group bacterium]
MTQSIIKKYRLPELKPGMVVGKDVLSDSGRLLVSPGTVLDEYLIRRLFTLDIYQVEIIALEEPDYVSSLLQPPVLDFAQMNQLFAQTDLVQTTEQQEFSTEYNGMLKRLKTCFTDIRLKNELDLPELLLLTQDVFALSGQGPDLIQHLHLTLREDDYLIHHSVDVALLAGFIARAVGDLTLEQERELVLTGLLHDIGKISIPLKILNKTGSLTDEEYQVIRSHPSGGYKFLKNLSVLSPSVLYGVLQHHERMDGSGYPLHAVGEKIHLFAKIIGLADSYSAMTSIKTYGETHSPFMAADMLKKDMYAGLFDTAVCNPFINHLYDALIGSWVLLSDGRKVQVVFYNEVAKNKFLLKTEQGEVLNLDAMPHLKITRMTNA